MPLSGIYPQNNKFALCLGRSTHVEMFALAEEGLWTVFVIAVSFFHWFCLF